MASIKTNKPDAPAEVIPPNVVKLTTPLEGHHGKITELVFKQPTARCYRIYGSPMIIKSDRTMTGEGADRVIAFAEFNEVACMNFIAEMADIDIITLDGLTAYDYLAARSKMLDLINTANPTEAPKG